jgi:hypothetical protein
MAGFAQTGDDDAAGGCQAQLAGAGELRVDAAGQRLYGTRFDVEGASARGDQRNGRDVGAVSMSEGRS